MLVGVIPFGLVAGATPATTGLGGGIVDRAVHDRVRGRLAAGRGRRRWPTGARRSWPIVAACTINLRMLLYSASLAPAPRRGAAAAAAVHGLPAHRPGLRGVASPAGRARRPAAAEGGPPVDRARRRVPFYFGAAVLLWVNWQICTIVGVLIGSALPEDIPLDFAVPLVFLVLLDPDHLDPARRGGGHGRRPRRGGRAPRPAPATCRCIVGALSGIAAGTLAEPAQERAAPATTRRSHPTRRWRRERGLGGPSWRWHRHVRDARVVPRVRAPPGRRAAGGAAPAAPDPAGRAGLDRRARAAAARGAPRPVAEPRFLAGVVAALVAWRTRNIALTLVVGMGLVMLIDAF